jgi:hypothetical protein
MALEITLVDQLEVRNILLLNIDKYIIFLGNNSNI